MIKEYNFSSLKVASEEMAVSIAEEIKAVIAKKGQFSIAVSGGNTPKLVFANFEGSDIDWSKVTITLTDERWVSTDDPQSNEKLVRDHFINPIAQQAQFVPLYGGERSPKAGHKNCSNRLKTIHFPLDLCYLGIGPDGHFASLFPHDKALGVIDQICVPIKGKGGRLPRMTLSKKVILQSKKIFILFSGKEKEKIYQKAFTNVKYKDVPLRLLMLDDKAPIYVFKAP